MNRFEITSSFDSNDLRVSKKEQQWELGHSQKCWVYIVLPRFEDSKDLQREDKARSGEWDKGFGEPGTTEFEVPVGFLLHHLVDSLKF